MPRNRPILGFFSMFLMWLAADGACADTLESLKAAYLVNFARLTEWPDSRFQSAQAPLVFCGPGEDGVTAYLRDAAPDVIGERTVEVRDLEAQSSMADCHVLFVRNAGDLLSIRRQSRDNSGVLIVADDEMALSDGAVIAYFHEAGRLRFSINMSAAHQQSLRMSARLLALAKTGMDAR